MRTASSPLALTLPATCGGTPPPAPPGPAARARVPSGPAAAPRAPRERLRQIQLGVDQRLSPTGHVGGVHRHLAVLHLPGHPGVLAGPPPPRGGRPALPA